MNKIEKDLVEHSPEFIKDKNVINARLLGKDCQFDSLIEMMFGIPSDSEDRKETIQDIIRRVNNDIDLLNRCKSQEYAVIESINRDIDKRKKYIEQLEYLLNN